MRKKICTSHFPVFFLLLLTLLFPRRSLAQLTVKGNEQVITYSGATAFVLTQQPVNPNLLVASGTNTFIMAVNPPTNAARVYVTNDTANACSNLTVSLASTGNSALNSFNQNLQAWQTISVQSGTGSFAATAPITLPASGTVAITSQPIIGSRIAVFVALSSGCLTTTVDVQVVFGTFTPAIGSVQGIVAPGQTASGIDPILIGALDTFGNAQSYAACIQTGSTCGTTGYSIPIGSNGNSISLAANTVATPNGLGVPLATLAQGIKTNANVTATPFVGVGGGSGVQGNNPPGLETQNTGFFGQVIGGTVISNNTLVEFGPGNFSTNFQASGGGGPGSFLGCAVSIQATAVTGTTPTLNVYFQDSSDGVNWTDRISFNQFTTVSSQWGSVSGAAGANPTAFTDGTLAAGSRIDGIIKPYGRLKFIVGGTTPNFTLTTGVACY